jgi:rubredoxin
MYCPVCGDELAVVTGTLTCVRGDMPLSDDLSAGLTEAFALKVRPTQRRLSFIPGGNWYCPVCGVGMIATDGSVTCPSCGGLLNDFVYPLIEFHPHRNVPED